MRFTSLTFLILLVTFSAKSQNYKWTAVINYPITIDQNFFGENYTGFIDLGFTYYCANYNHVSIGASFNAGIFSNNDNLDLSSLDSFKAIAYSLEPKLSLIGTIPTIEMVHPYVGVGYSFYIFDITGVNQGLGIIEDGEVLNGLSINGGFYIDISRRVFLNLEYDFTKVQRDDLIPDTVYNRNINFIKLGAGFRF